MFGTDQFGSRAPAWAARWVVFGLVLGLAHLAVRGADWEAGKGYRSAPLAVQANGHPGFALMPATRTGITFTNLLPERRHLTNQILLNGAGVAAGDVDGDGRCDLYFGCVDGRNALYRNQGDWRFEDVTETAGVGCRDLTTTGVAFADLDGDGDLDLIVNTLGNGTRLFYNDGAGRFRLAERALNPGAGGMTAALADVDGDGFLDLYLVNYRSSGLMDIPNARATFKTVNGKTKLHTVLGRPADSPEMANRFIVGPQGEILEQGEPDVLYLNRGGGNFEARAFADGTFQDEDGKALSQPLFDWGLSAMFRDINGDGLPDLYVCNDFQSPDRFWLNQGGARFKLIAPLALRKSSMFAMAVDFADINRDGLDDFLVLDMMSRDHQQRMRYQGPAAPVPVGGGGREDRPQYGLNTLQLNRGDLRFAEIAQFSGLPAAEWAWSCIFLDVDLDGFEDLLVASGMERAARDLDVVEYLRQFRASGPKSDAQLFAARRMFPRLETGNLAFRNGGDLTFAEVTQTWGLAAKGVCQGMALADLDNDGDQDLAVNRLNAGPALYRNETSAPRLAVRLKGLPPNTHGIGARVTVRGGAAPLQSQEMICGGRYLSCDDTLRTFAAGSLSNRLRVEVRWRSGRVSELADLVPNRVYEIAEDAAAAAGRAEGAPRTESAPPLFEDVSGLLGHTHQDEPFDDFVRQPLLPNKLSQLGPGLAWFDLDGDGWDDLFIGAGKGGHLDAFHNDGHGRFSPWPGAAVSAAAARDQTTVLGWRAGTNSAQLLIGLANYEDGQPTGAAVRGVAPPGLVGADLLPASESSPGPLALADIDGDGNLDLFVGGRVLPGKYPLAASSRLFHGEDGRFTLDPDNTRRLAGVGLVSGAVFSDLDGDGAPDLALACEWGPVRVFHNANGKLTEITKALGLEEFRGWWNGVSAGDLDGDGRLDLVAANWGRNSKYEMHRSQPLRLYYGDLAGAGAVDVVEAHFDDALQKLVPERQLEALAQSLPFVRGRFSSHRAYGAASLEEVLGESCATAKQVDANWLETTLFLNRGQRFEPRVFPSEAQFAPAFGVCVGDVDGDGCEDVFLAQNFFATAPETPRYDAGRGLWLRGDGQGGLAALPGQASGTLVYGEQRGAALCDYDGDGRLDVAVTQNRGPTKLYHNVAAKPGLRVRLEGPPGNPLAIGAVLRLSSGSRQGPLREVHAGAGYWSQDSAVQVLATPSAPTELWIRWPGGKTTTVAVPPNAPELVVNPAGIVRTRR